jgi:hypothetical protein
MVPSVLLSAVRTAIETLSGCLLFEPPETIRAKPAFATRPKRWKAFFVWYVQDR